MAGERSTAVAVGVLFVVATGGYMAGQALHGPILTSGDVLELAAAHRTRVLAGLLVELVGVLAIPLIALVFYPILRRYAEALALSYVGLRILEAAPLVIVDANLWSVVSLSEAYLASGSSGLQIADQLATLQAVNESAFLISVAIVFPVGSLLLNSVLWRTRLVPRVISGWGVFGAGLLLVGSISTFFELLPSMSATALEIVLSGPIAVQEMVLATWLIAKGVDVTTSRAGSA